MLNVKLKLSSHKFREGLVGMHGRLGGTLGGFLSHKVVGIEFAFGFLGSFHFVLLTLFLFHTFLLINLLSLLLPEAPKEIAVEGIGIFPLIGFVLLDEIMPEVFQGQKSLLALEVQFVADIIGTVLVDRSTATKDDKEYSQEPSKNKRNNVGPGLAPNEDDTDDDTEARYNQGGKTCAMRSQSQSREVKTVVAEIGLM
jgi:hypothetical protein